MIEKISFHVLKVKIRLEDPGNHSLAIDVVPNSAMSPE